MLTSTSIYLDNFYFNDTDLANMDLDDMDFSYFDTSIMYLIEIIDSMGEGGNIINIAKSKNYTNLIEGKLTQ